MQKWILIQLASLITVAGLTSVLMRAQATQTQTAQSDASIISGNDVGFRVDGKKDGRAVGTLMVRVSGKWIEATFGMTTNRLSEVRQNPHLLARGVTFRGAPHMIHRHDSGIEEWMAFFEDPDGQLLALMSKVAP